MTPEKSDNRRGNLMKQVMKNNAQDNRRGSLFAPIMVIPEGSNAQDNRRGSSFAPIMVISEGSMSGHYSQDDASMVGNEDMIPERYLENPTEDQSVPAELSEPDYRFPDHNLTTQEVVKRRCSVMDHMDPLMFSAQMADNLGQDFIIPVRAGGLSQITSSMISPNRPIRNNHGSRRYSCINSGVITPQVI